MKKGQDGVKRCHNYPFLMCLLLVSNNINHHGNSKEDHASRIVKIVNHASR